MIFLINGSFVDTTTAGASFAPAPFHAPTMAPVASGARVGRTAAQMLASKRSSGRRPIYTKSLRHYIVRFVRGKTLRPIGSVTTKEIETYLGEFKTPASKLTHLNRINVLFAYAVKRELIERNPCAKIEKPKVDSGTPTTLTVEQVRRLFMWAKHNKPAHLGFLALATFVGMRPTEIQRIRWDDVNLEHGIVTVSAAASKVRRRRIVKLQPAALAWLKYAKDKDALLPPSHMSNRRWRWQWTEVLGFKRWPQDILRHTCATMLLALIGDCGKVSTSLGNSPGILMRHYADLVPPKTAEEFWSIMP